MTSKKQRKVPELRFRGFTDDWEQRKLGDIGTLVGKMTNPQKTPDTYFLEYSMPAYDAGQQPKSVLGRTILSGRIQISGDVLLINKLNVRKKRIWLVKNAPNNAVSSSEFMPFRAVHVDSAFLGQLMSSNRITRLLESMSSGTSNSQKRVTPTGLLKLIVRVPFNLKEQRQIAVFFNHLDYTIALHQREQSLLEKLKQGYLQKLFPQKGQRQPELRFSGFTDDWEQRKLSWMLDAQDGIRRGPFGSALKKSLFVSKSDYVVYEQQNAIYDHYATRYNIPADIFRKLMKFELTPGDFIMSGAGTIGRISRVPEGVKKGVFNQALIRFKIDSKKTDAEFFLQFMRGDDMQRRLTESNPGSAITNLVPMNEVKKWLIHLPNLNEQKKIGDFLKTIDITLALHQQEIDRLQQLKQGYLQKMFV
jgi:type I restriction enzyme S subunit